MARSDWAIPMYAMIIIIIMGVVIIAYGGPGSLVPHHAKPTVLNVENEIAIVNGETGNISTPMNDTYLPLLSWMENYSGHYSDHIPVPVIVNSIWHNTSFNRTQLNFVGGTGNIYSDIPPHVSLVNYTFSSYKASVTLAIAYVGVIYGQLQATLNTGNLTPLENMTLNHQQSIIQNWFMQLSQISGALDSYYVIY